MRKQYDFSGAVKGKYAGKVDVQATPMNAAEQRRHASVTPLAGSPVEVVVEKAREAADQKGNKPPSDRVR